jgi:hypothetical protein
MWLIRGGPPRQAVVLFEYDASRSAEVPSRLLAGFSGTLQTDGYAGYNKVCRENAITHVGCWDHARRKFVESAKAMPAAKKKKGQVSKADVAISSASLREKYRPFFLSLILTRLNQRFPSKCWEVHKTRLFQTL